MAISDSMAALALVNGTAGGIVLVLPIIGIQAGYILIPVVILIASLCCYFTAVVMFQHLGKATTINKCLLNHFNSQAFCDFYNITMFLSFFGQMLVYYSLLVSQLQGVLYFLSPQIINLLPYFVAIFLLFLAILARFYNFQDDLIGYGVISLFAFCVFIGWIIIDREIGQKSVPPATSLFVNLGATISQGYSIHNMMIPIILRARHPKNYKKILLNTFIIAGIIYSFITYGCFAIVNRSPTIKGVGQTVQDYFHNQQWQVYLLRSIYILNIITVFPQFLTISKIRFFNIFSDQQIQSGIKLKDLAYYIIVIGICLLCKILKLRTSTIIELNGSIICFFQIFFIPIVIHLKCLWWDVSIKQMSFPDQYSSIKNNQYQISHEQQNKNDSKKESQIQQNSISNQSSRNSSSDKICPCKKQYQIKQWRYLQIFLSVIISIWGMFVLIYTLITVLFDDQSM